MEINLFSRCIKDLIEENDRVDVPYLGTFMAEMVPAVYSDRQTTIHPPYRKMSFHKADIALADGRLLLDKVVKETGVAFDQAGVELSWCLSRLCSELEGHKRCKLPGLGEMRANARNEFFFVPDDDLDIWPDGRGFEAIAIKVSEKMPDQVAVTPGPDRGAEMPDQVGHDEEKVGHDVQKVEHDVEKLGHDVQNVVHDEGNIRHEVQNVVHDEDDQVGHVVKKGGHGGMKPVWIVLIVVGALVVLFIAACYLFTDAMSPILDPLLYTKEELELLRG